MRAGSTLEFKVANGLVKRLDVYTLQVSIKEKYLRVTDNSGQTISLETKNESELIELFQAFDMFGC